MTDTRLPTDDQLWLCMSETMRSVILPRLDDPWARAALIRLIGLAEFAPKRGEDPSEQRTSETIACIDQLASNYPDIAAQLPGGWPGVDQGQVLDLCSQLLAASVGDENEQANAVRIQLKTLLKVHLTEDFTVSSPLITSFAGGLNDR